jgi:plasmid stabilization system protein ParE
VSGNKRIVWLNAAVSDLARLREFIRVNNPAAADRAAKRIIQAVDKISAYPSIGRPVLDIKQKQAFRDLFIPFAQGGYWLRYAVTKDEIVLVRIWHGRENRNENRV